MVECRWTDLVHPEPSLLPNPTNNPAPTALPSDIPAHPTIASAAYLPEMPTNCPTSGPANKPASDANRHVALSPHIASLKIEDIPKTRPVSVSRDDEARERRVPPNRVCEGVNMSLWSGSHNRTHTTRTHFLFPGIKSRACFFR